MPQHRIHVTSRPDGDAPEEIRDAWIGCVMVARPAIEGSKNFGLFTGQERVGVLGGHRVSWQDAMEALERQAPTMRAWWEAHLLPMVLTFDTNCCEVLPD